MAIDKNPEWLNDFVTASFGQFEIFNPQDFAHKPQADNDGTIQQQNKFENDGDPIKNSNVEGINDQTGDRFEVVVKTENNKTDSGMQVEFASGHSKDIYICASIDDFCNGRYSHLKTQPIQTIAEEIAKDYGYITNFIETSIASNSDSITIETALDVTMKIAKNSMLENSDYKKICSKLNIDDANIYNSYLKNANIKVLAPVSSVNYYLDYIKNFKEYKISSMPELQSRINSIEKFKIIATELYEEFKKDEILKNIRIGE